MMTENPIDRCLHGKSSPCSRTCPFPFDVREFLEKLQRGNFGAAYRLYKSSVVFPEIVCRLCEQPCAGACSASEEAEAIDLKALERAAIAWGNRRPAQAYYMPAKEQKIAVIGAGAAGLACAFKMAEKQYHVDLFEKEEKPGGSLRGKLDQEVLEKELKDTFAGLPCEFHYGEEIREDIQAQYDAVYVSSGASCPGSGEKVFVCEAGLHPVMAIAAAIRHAADLEWFLKTGTRKAKEEPDRQAAAVQNAVGSLQPGSRTVKPENGEMYSKAEARAEAERCAKCDCSLCMQQCVLLRQYGAAPQALANDVGLSLNLFPQTQGRAGMREIGSCNDCGLCEAVCPVGINIGEMLMKAREELQKKQIIPPAHHEYWIRDMLFANGPSASVFYVPEKGCSHLFFPGCQLGGSNEEYVRKTFEKLQSVYPDSGILLRCCGAPALWAGDRDLAENEFDEIRTAWKQAGNPVMVLTCPSCLRMFREHMPEIPVEMLYTMDEIMKPEEKKEGTLAVFDPCASRRVPELWQAVRAFLTASGRTVEELENHESAAQCCSWGGHGYAVNPLFVKTLASEQASKSESPYLTYCINCRDIFSSQGKDTYHILDLLLGMEDTRRRVPTLSERRVNRRKLKQALAQKLGLPEREEEEPVMVLLTMEETVRKKLDEDLILEEDISAVIDHCKTTGIYLIDEDNGHFIGHLQRGYITYWVEFGPNKDGSYTLYNAYSHRMKIKEDQE